MQQLIYTHAWGDEGCSGTSYLPFEYESKDQFVFDLLEKYKDHNWNGKHSNVLVFNDDSIYLDKHGIETIEHNIQTLHEWFNDHKRSSK